MLEDILKVIVIMKKHLIWIGLAICVLPIKTQAKACYAEQNHCIVDKTIYRIYRFDDNSRKSTAAILAIKNGRASFTGLYKMPLTEAELRFGKSKIVSRDRTNLRSFELVGFDKIKESKPFQITVELEGYYISKYMVSGPGISKEVWTSALPSRGCGGAPTEEIEKHHVRKGERASKLSPQKQLIPNVQ